MKANCTKSGFSLLELILVLMLVGLLAGLGSMLIVHMVQGYVQSKKHAVLAQDIELAMGRLVREARFADHSTNAPGGTLITRTANSITFPRGGTNLVAQLSGSTLQLGGNVLMKNVASFTIYPPTTITTNTELISFVINPGSGMPVYSNQVYVGP